MVFLRELKFWNFLWISMNLTMMCVCVCLPQIAKRANSNCCIKNEFLLLVKKNHSSRDIFFSRVYLFSSPLLSLRRSGCSRENGTVVIFLTCYMNFLESIAIGNRPWIAAIGRDRENKTPPRRRSVGDSGESELSTSYDAKGKWMERKKQGLEKREIERSGWASKREKEAFEDNPKEREKEGSRVGSRIEWFWLADQFHTLGPPTVNYPSRGIWPFVSLIFSTSYRSTAYTLIRSWPLSPSSRCFILLEDHDIPTE